MQNGGECWVLSGTMGVVGVGKKMKGVAALGVISVEDR